MKAVILAGGLGTRISEETYLKPKPMVEIGGKPILWHIMKIFSAYGIQKFIICCGYKGYLIKEYFANYRLHNVDFSVNTLTGDIKVQREVVEPWEVTLVDTGETTATGGRLKRVRQYLEKGETFLFTYGDGLSNVNISDLLRSHINSEKLATVTAVQQPGRYGVLSLNNDLVVGFTEKPQVDGSYINGGYFAINERVIDYIESDDTPWESSPLEKLAAENQLNAYKHTGFWQAMDTLREKSSRNSLGVEKSSMADLDIEHEFGAILQRSACTHNWNNRI